MKYKISKNFFFIVDVIPIIFQSYIILTIRKSKLKKKKKKSYKHSNEELLNQKFHKQNRNIFKFQPNIIKY
jgi:hypothetical protein